MSAEPKTNRFIEEKDYIGIYESALERTSWSGGMVCLLAFDIDDTLANSSGTGDRQLLPAEVLEALQLLQSDKKVYLMAATGRTPQDAQVLFGSFKIPLVARDGSWIRYPDQQIREIDLPAANEFESLADQVVRDSLSKGLDVKRMGELSPA
jgi:trehalose-6-phosphatase